MLTECEMIVMSLGKLVDGARRLETPFVDSPRLSWLGQCRIKALLWQAGIVGPNTLRYRLDVRSMNSVDSQRLTNLL